MKTNLKDLYPWKQISIVLEHVNTIAKLYLYTRQFLGVLDESTEPSWEYGVNLLKQEVKTIDAINILRTHLSYLKNEADLLAISGECDMVVGINPLSNLIYAVDSVVPNLIKIIDHFCDNSVVKVNIANLSERISDLYNVVPHEKFNVIETLHNSILNVYDYIDNHCIDFSELKTQLTLWRREFQKKWDDNR